MSLTMPRLRRIPRPHPRHRAADRVAYLEHQLAGAEHLINGLRADRDQLADEVEELKAALAVARQANTANAEAVTVPTDVSVLRAAAADETDYVDATAARWRGKPADMCTGWRVTSRTIRVLTLREALDVPVPGVPELPDEAPARPWQHLANA